MADPDARDAETVPPPIGGENNLNMNNERLDCENLDEMTERLINPDRPAFPSVLLRFFGNIFEPFLPSRIIGDLTLDHAMKKNSGR